MTKEPMQTEEHLFFRNCSPSEAWWDEENDRPSSLLFFPTPKDGGMLSVASSTDVSPAEHFEDFTENLGLSSRGVWAVSETETNPVCDPVLPAGSEISLPAIADPGPDKPIGHCLLDMTELSKKMQKRVSRILARYASVRGQLYPSRGSR